MMGTKIKRAILPVGLLAAGVLALSAPAEAVVSGSFNYNDSTHNSSEFDQVNDSSLTQDNVQNGICGCTGNTTYLAQWPDGHPKKVVEYALAGHQISNGYWVDIYYRKWDNGEWHVREKQLCDQHHAYSGCTPFISVS